MITRRTLLSALPLLLVGCASRPELPPGATRKEGSFSCQVIRDQKSETVQGRYELVYSKTQTSLELINPLGATVAKVTVNDQGATLDYEGKTTQAASAQALMNDAFGFSLPVSMMTSWLQGSADKSQPFTQMDPDTFAQAQWRVDVAKRYLSGKPQILLLRNLVRTHTSVTMRLSVIEPGEWY